MKIVHKQIITKIGEFSNSKEFELISKEIEEAVKKITWPKGSKSFLLNPNSKGKGRGQGNGVKPIKEACMSYLKSLGWQDELRLREKGVVGTGPLDIVKKTQFGLFALEWETGNISSTHRALNKICLGILQKDLIGGVLMLPSKELYPYLTDRIGNYREIIPYLPMWESLPYKDGVVFIFVVEQNGLDEHAPRIPKGTDGRALL